MHVAPSSLRRASLEGAQRWADAGAMAAGKRGLDGGECEADGIGIYDESSRKAEVGERAATVKRWMSRFSYPYNYLAGMASFFYLGTVYLKGAALAGAYNYPIFWKDNHGSIGRDQAVLDSVVNDINNVFLSLSF
jgi:hypothetical protein